MSIDLGACGEHIEKLSRIFLQAQKEYGTANIEKPGDAMVMINASIGAAAEVLARDTTALFMAAKSTGKLEGTPESVKLKNELHVSLLDWLTEQAAKHLDNATVIRAKLPKKPGSEGTS